MSPLAFQDTFMIGSLGIPSAVLFLVVLAAVSVASAVLALRSVGASAAEEAEPAPTPPAVVG